MANLIFHYGVNLKSISSMNKSYGELCLEKFTITAEVDFVGHETDDEAIKTIEGQIGDLNNESNEFWSEWSSLKIENQLLEAFNICNKSLPLKYLPVHVFIFPWSNTEKQEKEFKGITAVAAHESVLFLFINPKSKLLEQGIPETFAHEFTHLYYYQASKSSTYSLYENMIMEGIAEVFREEVVGGEVAPWSIQLSITEAKNVYNEIKIDLDTTDKDLIREILFGSDKFSKWTGYSIGYHLVKSQRSKNINMEWTKFIEKLISDRPTLI